MAEVRLKYLLNPEEGVKARYRREKGMDPGQRLRTASKGAYQKLTEEEFQQYRKKYQRANQDYESRTSIEHLQHLARRRALGELPPPDSPRRCQAFSQTSKAQCVAWATEGQVTCANHRKRGLLMPSYYRRVLAPTLKQVLEEGTGIDPDEQVSLYEELGLMRQYASDAVAQYSQAFSMKELLVKSLAEGKQGVKEEQVKAAENLVMAAGEVMAERLKKVSELAQRCSGLADKQKDRFNIHDLNFVVERIAATVFEACGEENSAIAIQITKNIESQMIIPSKAEGTATRAADSIAEELDASVPYVASDESPDALDDEPEDEETDDGDNS